MTRWNRPADHGRVLCSSCVAWLVLVAAMACESRRPGSTRDSAAGELADTVEPQSARATDAVLSILSAPSEAPAMRALSDSFATHEGVSVAHETEAGATLPHAVEQSPDIVAVVETDLARLPSAAQVTWHVGIARDRIVLAYSGTTRGAATDDPAMIDSTSWWRVITRPRSRVGRADPSVTAVGYETLFTIELAEQHYLQQSLADTLRMRSMIPRGGTEADLVAALKAGELDYIWCRESTARASGLPYVRLPHHIDLGEPADSLVYAAAQTDVIAAGERTARPVRARPIVHTLSIPSNAPNQRYAERFVRFVLSSDGQRILRAAHLDPLARPSIVGTNAPPAIVALITDEGGTHIDTAAKAHAK